MILFSAKNIYAQAIFFNTSFILSSSSFPSFIPHALKAQKFCKVKPIHRNHVFGMTVFYQFQITGNDKGLICHDEKVAYRPFLKIESTYKKCLREEWGKFTGYQLLSSFWLKVARTDEDRNTTRWDRGTLPIRNLYPKWGMLRFERIKKVTN